MANRQDAQRKARLDDFDGNRKTAQDNRSFELNEKEAMTKAEQSDPASAASKAFRDSIKSNFPRIADSFGKNWSNVTAADQSLIFKPLELKEQIDARKQTAAIMADSRRDAQGIKADEKNDKKKSAMFEIEDRRTNINANIDALDRMIEDNGTYETFGSHNQDLDRLVDQIATDMAKLQDPTSVARPAEVDQIKRTLIKPGFQNSNSTARDLLKNFRGEVARRADGAYKIRGLTLPGSDKAANSETKKPSWAK